ncbi:MAG: hypothetical protein ACRCY4_08050, partial [Brevinema sp.]
FMALAYNALGDRRQALLYWRLAYLLHQQPISPLLGAEVDFLNFAYATKYIQALNINSLDQNQRELYLGILFADGSKDSLRQMDAILSAKQSPFSPYEEALSLYRRGLTTRAMRALDNTANSLLRKENPWFYLDLRYKLMKRLQLHDEIQPVAASLGGMAYLVGKNNLALSYLNDIDENDNGEKSYLIGMMYLRQNNYSKATESLRKHLRYPNSRYYSEVLDTIIRITINGEDGTEEIARRYINLYERRYGKDSSESLAMQAKLAIKEARYDEAVALEESAIEKTPEPLRTSLYFDLADFYSSEWLKTNKDKQILMTQARLYSKEAVNSLKKYSDSVKETELNNYAYILGLSSEMGLDMDIVKRIIVASEDNPTPEILDTAAVVAMESFRLQMKGAENPTPYFEALERSIKILEDERNYAQSIAPPYVDESTGLKPAYYEIYLHLAAWHWVNGREDVSLMYEKMALDLVRNPQAAAQHLDDLKKSWSQVSL